MAPMTQNLDYDNICDMRIFFDNRMYFDSKTRVSYFGNKLSKIVDKRIRTSLDKKMMKVVRNVAG